MICTTICKGTKYYIRIIITKTPRNQEFLDSKSIPYEAELGELFLRPKDFTETVETVILLEEFDVDGRAVHVEFFTPSITEELQKLLKVQTQGG